MSTGHDRNGIGMHLQARAAARSGGARTNVALAPLLAAQAADSSAADHRSGTAAAFWRRYRLEHAWLTALPEASALTATVLALRSAASQPASPEADQPPAEHLAAFRASLPDLDRLEPALRALGLPATAQASGPAELAAMAAAWPASQAVEVLLASGGDDRLTLDPATGLNRYGCAPWPRPEVIGFASCTASSLAEPQFLAAETARRDLIRAALAAGTEAALAAANADAAGRILAHFSVSDIAEAILAASGTDAALIVTGLLAAEQPDAPLTSILVSPAETGSGVPDAVQGRHFSIFAPSGRAVPKGGALDGLRHPPHLSTVALRHEDGTPRSAQQVAAACETAIAAALPTGRAVLHAIDGSKTGLTAPDRPTLLRLSRRFGGALDVVVDACQARIEPALVRWYLQQGFPVLVTGSKFFAAPGFCGAVLFPRARLGRIAAGVIPDGLAAYAGVTDSVGSRLCPGLLLRWTAALHDMAAFGRLPADEVGRRLDVLGQSIERALRRDARLRLVAAPRPGGLGWSDRRSVFTFMVRGQAGWLDAARLRPLYLALHDDPSGAPCQIGQPVQLGGAAQGGLRLAVSGAQICTGGDHEEALGAVIGKLGGLLDRADAVAVLERAVFVG